MPTIGDRMTADADKIREFVERGRKITDAATPGPWDDSPASDEWKSNKENNAEFCRKARTMLPQALAVIDVLLTQLNRVGLGNDDVDYWHGRLLAEATKEGLAWAMVRDVQAARSAIAQAAKILSEKK